MNAMKNKKIGHLCLVTLLMLLLPSQVEAAPKEENIYANLSQDGSVSTMYVVNRYQAQEQESICDYGNYEDIVNLTTTKKLSASNQKLCLTIPKGSFAYQATLKENQLPWNITIKYQLDGKEMPAEEIASKSGHLVLSIAITKNEKVDPTYFEHYLLQVSTSFDSKKTSHIEAEGATIANVSNKKQLTYQLLPNKEQTLVISADVENFSLDEISINGVLMNMDVSLEGIDELMTSIKSLQTSIKTIATANKNMNASIKTINEGITKLTNGAETMKNALQQLGESGSKITEGSHNILSLVEQLDQNIALLNNYHKELTDEQIEQMITAYQALATIDTKNQTLYETTIKMLTLLKQDKQFFEQVSALQITEKMRTFDSGLTAYTDSLNKLISGYSDLYQGIESLYTGAFTLQTASDEFLKGTSTLEDKTASLDQVIAARIEAMTSAFQASDYQSKSFISEKNTNVSSVQFIMKTEKIKAQEEKVSLEVKEEKVSFLDKFLNLFKAKE